MKKLIYALRFMTILPLPWREEEDLVQVSRSSGTFPLVGLLIGLVLVPAGLGARRVFSAEAAALVQTLLWAWLTGGLHLDGLSDSFDGLGCRRDRERMLAVMKDSSVGAFGALGLIFQILIKLFFLRELNALSPWLVLLAPLTGRWGQLIAIGGFPSARKDGMGRFFREHIRRREILFGLGCTLAVYLLAAPWTALSILLIHGLFTAGLSQKISSRLGGLTGDVYGLVCEAGESLVLVLTVLYLKLLPGASAFQGLQKLVHILL